MRRSFTISILFAVAFASTSLAQTAETGQKQFETRCAGCHGTDGGGGDHGPGIIDVRRPRASTPEAVRELIRKGIPEAGMPGLTLPDADLDAIAAFIGSLKALAIERNLPGDVAAGERFFFGKGKCVGCHMVGGRGGILGPELSNLGRERRVAQIEQALLSPGTRRSKAASVQTTDGRTLRRLAQNENNLQLQLPDLARN